jgi:hypothetical protein
MKILAAITGPARVRRVWESLGLPSEVPRPRPARSPPQTKLSEQRAYGQRPVTNERFENDGSRYYRHPDPIPSTSLRGYTHIRSSQGVPSRCPAYTPAPRLAEHRTQQPQSDESLPGIMRTSRAGGEAHAWASISTGSFSDPHASRRHVTLTSNRPGRCYSHWKSSDLGHEKRSAQLPGIRTFPLGRRIAAWSTRGTAMLPTRVKVPEEGS